jgi:hypothetical protein
MDVTVNAYPSVNAGNDVTLCSNSGAYTLPGFNPSGGTWSGSGVSSAGVFTPSTTGTFILTYSYTNSSFLHFNRSTHSYRCATRHSKCRFRREYLFEYPSSSTQHRWNMERKHLGDFRRTIYSGANRNF